MKFDAKTDINLEELKRRARPEAERIAETDKDRTFEQIYANVLRGQAAELYLIEHHGYYDDERIYKDIFNSDGESVEVKVTKYSNYVPYVLERCKERKQIFRDRYSNIVVVFTNNEELDTIYELAGIYRWNGKDFK